MNRPLRSSTHSLHDTMGPFVKGVVAYSCLNLELTHEIINGY